MSLDITVSAVVHTNIFDLNITHNLAAMAKEAGLYQVMWRPEEIGIKKCSQALPLLLDGLNALKTRKEDMLKHNPPNGWGTYDDFVKIVTGYAVVCKNNPDGEISVSR